MAFTISSRVGEQLTTHMNITRVSFPAPPCCRVLLENPFNKVIHGSIRFPSQSWWISVINKNDWIILFGGAGREACIEEILSAGVKVSAIFLPERRSAKLEDALKLLKKFHCQMIEVTKENLVDALRAHEGKALLSIGFPYLVPGESLSLFHPAINIHPTLLPRYRGPTTGAYILMHNESESGSTVHHMTEKMDRGDIIAQNRVVLTPFDTIRSLQRKVYQSEPELIIEAFGLLEADAPARPQDENVATEFAKKRTPSDSEIDPARPLVELFDEIRACDPDEFPAYFIWHGEKVCIKLWRPHKQKDDVDLI